MQTIPVDTARLSIPKFLSASPKIADRATGLQKVNAANLPVWTVQVMLINEENGIAQIEILNIPSSTIPTFEPLTEVQVHNMTARYWEMNGRSGMSLSAERITEADPLADLA